ncbi:disease resistance protein At4g27190-like [Syzygium oleosum]|uniref:disease resistance protein At4g27190-like n=1 Tax=Syzygium oleosum TaxID=219896 RepID=UPI0024B8D420|nr:disease resistance protein At4g27190-like [Syzygium oleosum]
MKALDDEKLKVIGIYGPGGVGKTTLLEEVNKKLRKEGRPFPIIVKAEVSQTPDLNNIRDQIADALSLNLKDKQSPQGRRDVLFQRLNRDPDEKVLIILDNLWTELDLKAVGIPSGDESSGCKLLLTSRFKDVLEKEMCADKTFRLEGLNNDEAFRLFEKTVGERLKDNEELKAMATQVVEMLAGLPLLIISVAKSLKNSNVFAWKNALKKIDKEKMETIVRLSYDHLQSDDTKSLFLLCGLIGGTIQVELLLGLGMGLGLFEGFNNMIENSRNILNDMLDSLRSVCLLLDSGDDKDNVTIHDLYREVVVSNAFCGQRSLMINNNYDPWPKEKLEKCWACLVNVGSDRLAELMLCRFPHVKILMLSKQYDMGDCNDMDFTYMKELRALYLCSMHIASLPSSMEILGNLRSLSINCYVEDVAILGKLKALQILSFAGSTISRLPKEIGELTNLRSLNLSHCYSLEIIEPGALKGLINLEELHMKGSFDQWMGKHEIPSESCGARLAELKSLTKLASLEISIRHPIILLEDGDLPFGNLVRFWINIGNAKVRKFKGLKTMGLNLEGCDNILSIEWVQKALQKTQYLYLCKLSEFKKSDHELCTQGFRELKYLDIDDSPSIKYIANSSDDLPLVAFTKLESLCLENLINLEKIYHGPIAPECFSKLKELVVIEMGLAFLFPVSVAKCLREIRDIRVMRCPNMKAVIVDEEGRDEGTDDIIEFPLLKGLHIYDCPTEKFFSNLHGKKESGTTNSDSQDAYSDCFFDQKVSLPSLEKLELESVGSFKRMWHGELPKSSFDKLADLSLRGCSDLLDVFPSTIIGRLHILERVWIGKCPSLESLFDCGSLDSKTVSGARSLRHVVKSDSQTVLGFPSLTLVDVGNCSKLRYLFPNLTATTLEKLDDLRILECGQMKEVVPKKEGEKAEEDDESPQPFFNEMVTFPNLRGLVIKDVQWKELWNNQIPTDSFCKLERLYLGNCDNLRCIAPNYMWKRLKCCLGSLIVTSCRSIEIIYESDGTVTKSDKLRCLNLSSLENLRHIWQYEGLPNIPFPNLRFIRASHCPRLEILFPTLTAEFLGQIEMLQVEDCQNMELIAGHGECGEATGMTITFSKLTNLGLKNLQKFRSYLPEEYSAEFPLVKDVYVHSCGTEPNQGKAWGWVHW